MTTHIQVKGLTNSLYYILTMYLPKLIVGFDIVHASDIHVT